MFHTSAWALFRSSATSLSKSSSFISVSKRSAPPSSKSFESCCFDSISLSIFSSTVPRQTNQATDRAFRIGQTKNVLVHKFVCRGTVEEKIGKMIESKQQLIKELLEGGADLM